jgi:hypothetical protein
VSQPMGVGGVYIGGQRGGVLGEGASPSPWCAGPRGRRSPPLAQLGLGVGVGLLLPKTPSTKIGRGGGVQLHPNSDWELEVDSSSQPAST